MHFPESVLAKCFAHGSEELLTVIVHAEARKQKIKFSKEKGIKND
jgi:hypothetical protein